MLQMILLREPVEISLPLFGVIGHRELLQRVRLLELLDQPDACINDGC